MADAHRRDEESPMMLVLRPTGEPGLDRILGGGLPAGRAHLITGEPGTGKTTLGNQLVFGHAASGQTAIYASFLTESYDAMLVNMRGFGFTDLSLVGTRLQFISLMADLAEGMEAALATIRRIIRDTGATLLVIDGAMVIEDLITSNFDLRRFAQQLQTYAGLLQCTVVLLTSHTRDELRSIGAHVDGIIALSNELVGSRATRQIEILKMRGVAQITGAHEFSITGAGLVVHPRLESIAGRNRPPEGPQVGLGTGIPGLDAMLGGGLLSYSSTLIIGTPGAGKTLVGLSFLAEGASRGERGLIAGFHEPARDLEATASRIGLDIDRFIDNGMIRVMWDSPTELSVDEWAWRLIATIEEHRPARLFIDCLSDIQRLIAHPQRLASYVGALVNELRSLQTTVMIATEIDSYVDQQLVVPVPAASATMDNGLLLRQVEMNSTLHRLISVLKARQAATDPVIREFNITDTGINVSRPFVATTGLLAGRAIQPEDQDPENDL